LKYLLKRTGFDLQKVYFWNYPPYTYKNKTIKLVYNNLTKIWPQLKEVIFIIAKNNSDAELKLL